MCSPPTAKGAKHAKGGLGEPGFVPARRDYAVAGGENGKAFNAAGHGRGRSPARENAEKGGDWGKATANGTAFNAEACPFDSGRRLSERSESKERRGRRGEETTNDEQGTLNRRSQKGTTNGTAFNAAQPKVPAGRSLREGLL